MPALTQHCRHSPARHRAAFTLLEMTVVLAVIGLLIGGVLEGRALVHKSELQSIMRDFGKFSDAYYQFQQQFSAKPGDFNNTTQKATAVWGTPATSDQTTPYNYATNCFGLLTASSAVTCDGDGNGYIAGPFKTDGTGTLTNPPEIFTAWQQLSNAKLIDGKYTGVGPNANPGVNVPAGRLTNSGYIMLTQAPIASSTDATNSPLYFYGNYGTYVIIGAAPVGTATGLSDNKLLSPKDAYLIDSKTDDGYPASGQITTYFKYPDGSSAIAKAAAPNACLLTSKADGTGTAADTTTMSYNVSLSGQYCNLIDIIDSKSGN